MYIVLGPIRMTSSAHREFYCQGNWQKIVGVITSRIGRTHYAKQAREMRNTYKI